MRSRASMAACSLASALGLWAAPGAVAASKMTVVDFGDRPSNLFLNDAGQVVGNFRADSAPGQGAFLYSGGRFIPLASGVEPAALAADGTVIDGRGPFDWYDGNTHPTSLGPTVANTTGVRVGAGHELTSYGLVSMTWQYQEFSGAEKKAIGDYGGFRGFGPVSGQYFENHYEDHARTAPGDPIGQGTMSVISHTEVPTAVNDAGVMVGGAALPYDLDGPRRAFADGPLNSPYHGFKDLGTLGGLTSDANAINDAGQVVGKADTAAGNSHAFLYSNGKMTDLGTLPGFSTSAALGLNNKGDIVGTSGGRAFLFSNGIMEDLNDRLPASLGITLDEADKVNDSGQIVAMGRGADGVEHGYLLSPAATPEPTALALLVTVGAGAGVARLRKRKV